jgi:hypothetical protein
MSQCALFEVKPEATAILGKTMGEHTSWDGWAETDPSAVIDSELPHR